ncbi:MAG: EamA/RhaT family transporter, partial [Lachnospiraceae bacterium]|nr:EamA/RhaT family transporter [Lachnospiraceae bacterium]
MKRQTKGILYVLIAAVLFSMGGLFVKLVPWNPLAINGIRNLIALIVFGIYLKVTHHKLVINGAVLFGAVCMAGTTTLYCL